MSRAPAEVLVIGAGAAGLIAATEAARAGRRTRVLERNTQAGIKILVSGGGHCNVTTSLSAREGARHFGAEAERWLRPALRACRPGEVRRWLREEGVETYEAEFEKVWPVSMRARDVRDALLRRLERSGAELDYGVRARSLQRRGDVWALSDGDGWEHCASRVILATGGLSYPKTGTVGDGFRMLAELGVPLRERVPALAPLASDAEWVRGLAGLTLEDCEVQLREASGRIVWRRRRPLLFTHRGVSGPGPMDACSRVERSGGRLGFHVDLCPDAGEEELRVRLFAGGGALGAKLRRIGVAKRLAAVVLGELGLEAVDAAQVPRAKRRELLGALKGLEIPVRGSLGFDQAELTAGGVPLEEVEPRTMELRRWPGLLVCGELLDVDGPIGGFSFWVAFATGYVAGRGV